MPENYDLHCHSTASDGALSPTALLQRAHEQGVTALALTDHDTVAGLDEARLAATAAGIRLIPGIELSTSWQNKCLHIVGLGIDPDYPPLREATQNLQIMRMERAEKIADKLEKKRIPGALEAVKKAAGEGMITRSHFADFLLSQFHVSTQQEAFDRYLGAGKSAFVATTWSDMALAVNWITKSGGVAVLAHPLRYKLTASWMKRLLAAFKEAGGLGIEVVTGRYNSDEIKTLAAYASRFELAGSVGSDFHNPSNQWIELGRLAPLPENIKPVWELFN
ncbi:MAG: PHP domain-containing protein [Methylobacter sp.]|nr:PHP domain-containing protein [Methylobacter sp.]MDP2099071.1 PHP domain-containing protein [Methylobacter sp.]MDP2429480.1 PHP domain-containing protein [Methylobacter sp.]MDP3055486.1 PHP domain-containing protein [Methylobacter sp.]MDP3361866.1 PHP domain-containing protein [Methylobacter sp.]